LLATHDGRHFRGCGAARFRVALRCRWLNLYQRGVDGSYPQTSHFIPSLESKESVYPAMHSSRSKHQLERLQVIAGEWSFEPHGRTLGVRTILLLAASTWPSPHREPGQPLTLANLPSTRLCDDDHSQQRRSA
jgi:hypothetical protein